jgi:hypothetical protein
MRYSNNLGETIRVDTTTPFSRLWELKLSTPRLEWGFADMTMVENKLFPFDGDWVWKSDKEKLKVEVYHG